MSYKNPYSPEIGQMIAQYFAAGYTFGEIAELGPWAPTAGVISGWRAKYPEFDKLICANEKAHADALIDQTIDIADNEWDHKRAAVRIKARQFKASKLNRDKYGEKVEVNHTLGLDMGALLAEAERRLVTSAGMVDVTPAAEIVTLDDILS